MAMTFEDAKTRTAADLRKVAALLNEEADAVAAGDLQRMADLIDEKLPLWFEMLMIRYAHVCEERRAAPATNGTQGGEA